MPPPSLSYASRSSATGYDPTTFSDDEDDVASTTTSNSQSFRSSGTSYGVVLGFADGPIPSTSELELEDWKISRIGGEPTFPPLSSAPPTSSTLCPSCTRPMRLVTQIYCPLETSLYERVVYLFGCSNKTCRGKATSVRAWRALSKWVDPEEDKKKKREEEDRIRKEKEVKVDLGSLIFGGAAAAAAVAGEGGKSVFNPFAAPPPSSNIGSNPFAPSSSSTPANTLTDTSSSTSDPSPPIEATTFHTWPGYSSIPAQYLTTSYEPTSSTTTKKSTRQLESTLSNLSLEDADASTSQHREGKASGGRTKKGSTPAAGSSRSTGGADGEAYEVQKIKGVDEVFLRFQERVAREPEQVIRCIGDVMVLVQDRDDDADRHLVSNIARYELSGEPLPFSAKSSPYETIYQPSPDGIGSYSSRRVPLCATCKNPSAFEYQAMPNLVNVLNKALRGREDGEGEDEEESFDWASVWVFTCADECVNEQSQQAWREDVVFVEWEE
ncbi:BQ2448_1825 [Microbotryum intermedium]|uniref:BQ2448_1825 protein n=1 Tax=Microbotryum intermedium TaxID=269621 RepID=A0A238FE99_9BASI|nr:BQ2448_1825 [Microbotryum intermedium]